MTVATSAARTAPTGDIAETYARDGFVFPIDVMSAAEAGAVRADLEAGEAELASTPDRLGLLRSYPDRLLPSFDAIVRHPVLLAAAESILGPDLMVWSGGLFIKEANTPHIVSWHQDLTYWGLDDAEEVTAWVALSPSTLESGCMRFVPGSHRQNLVPHNDTFAEDNLLSRGQEIAVEVDEAEAADIVLQPGQASLHHGHLFHSSGPNRTSNRRVGAAIRYIKPSMRQNNGAKSLVALVQGEDRFGHFRIAEPPAARLTETDFALCAADADIKRGLLYDGVDADQGKRY